MLQQSNPSSFGVWCHYELLAFCAVRPTELHRRRQRRWHDLAPNFQVPAHSLVKATPNIMSRLVYFFPIHFFQAEMATTSLSLCLSLPVGNANLLINYPKLFNAPNQQHCTNNDHFTLFIHKVCCELIQCCNQATKIYWLDFFFGRPRDGLRSNICVWSRLSPAKLKS